MKYICLGYISDALVNGWTEQQQQFFLDECLAYDHELKKNGHFTGGEALQGIHTATTIRMRNGKPVITDGPFAETKEQLGGILILEARDLNQAIQLMTNHPSTRMGGTWEIRPSEELINKLYEEKYGKEG